MPLGRVDALSRRRRCRDQQQRRRTRGEVCCIATSLIETAKAHGDDPLAYLTKILQRLPTTLNRDIDGLLPISWKPSGNRAPS